MKAAYELVGKIMEDLEWENNVSPEDDIMKHIESALREFEIGMSLFVTQNLIDHYEWIEDNKET